MEYLVIGIFALVFLIIILSYFFSKKAKVKRKLKKANSKKISAFRDGDIAKLVGRVELVDEPLFAPLSDRKCSYYHIQIEQKKSSGKSSHWKTIIEEENRCRYLIKEGQHYAFINDSKLKSYIVQDKSYSSGFMNDAPQKLVNYLRDHGVDSEGFLGMNKTLKYKEAILEVDEQVAVFGKGTWEKASALNLPKQYGKVLEITADLDHYVYLSDDPSTTAFNKTEKKSTTYNQDENLIHRY